MNGQGMAMPTHMGEVKTHLEEHMQYPATKQEIVTACNDMSHVSQREKDWVEKNLPDKTYMSADEVEKDLNLM